MALIKAMRRANKERYSVHAEIGCQYYVFERNGKRYLQLDTSGSDQRDFPGKVSQTIQLDEDGARAIRAVLDEVFPRPDS